MLHFPRFLLECRLVLLGNDNTSGKQMSSEFGGSKSNSFQASCTAPLESENWKCRTYYRNTATLERNPRNLCNPRQSAIQTIYCVITARGRSANCRPLACLCER